MTRPRPQYMPTPRIWNADQVACRLGWKVSTFYDHRDELEAIGFPSKVECLGGWDSAAIEAWLDRQSGLEHASDDELAKELEGWSP